MKILANNRTQNSSYLFFIIFIIIILLPNLSSARMRHQQLLPGYIEVIKNSSGELEYNSPSASPVVVKIRLNGLPEGFYLLTLNENRQYRIQQELQYWKHIGGERYLDLDQISVGPDGSYEGEIEFSLPPGNYILKFFVKKAGGNYPSVLFTDFLKVNVKEGEASGSPGSGEDKNNPPDQGGLVSDDQIAGLIKTPENKNRVQRHFYLSGTVSGPTRNLWLVERIGNLFWPKDPKLSPRGGNWAGEVFEGGYPPGGKFDILLLDIPEKTDRLFTDWLMRGSQSGSYPGLPDSILEGAKILDEKTYQLVR